MGDLVVSFISRSFCHISGDLIVGIFWNVDHRVTLIDAHQFDNDHPRSIGRIH